MQCEECGAEITDAEYHENEGLCDQDAMIICYEEES